MVRFPITDQIDISIIEASDELMSQTNIFEVSILERNKFVTQRFIQEHGNVIYVKNEDIIKIIHRVEKRPTKLTPVSISEPGVVGDAATVLKKKGRIRRVISSIRSKLRRKPKVEVLPPPDPDTELEEELEETSASILEDIGGAL